MSDLNRPPKLPKDRGKITGTRIVVWIVVGGVGIYLVITGIIGIITKS
jgi:hypothetical protein